jgi:hypothetical protein
LEELYEIVVDGILIEVEDALLACGFVGEDVGDFGVEEGHLH